MLRAIVISLLIHLLLFVSLFSLPASPPGGLQNAGDRTLLVGFKPTGEMGKKDAGFSNAVMPIATLPARGLPARTNNLVSPAAAKGHGEQPVEKERREDGVPHPVEAAENLASLPADMEREYRMSLARAAREFPYYPAASMAKGQQGIVRMSISYWSRLGVPKVALEQSSGYGELDQEALKTVALALGKVPLPAGIQGINFRMPYAVEYRLAD